MTKCSVCQLPDGKRGAIDAALRDGASLQAISERTGVTKSSLWRHGKHITNGQKPPTVAGEAAEVSEALLPTGNTPTTERQARGPAAETRTRENALRRLDPEVVRQQALERCELLWNESLDGLSAAKEPVIVSRADGSKIELPGDLRARASFIREARGVVEFDARLNGLTDGGLNPASAISIVIPVQVNTTIERHSDEVLGIGIKAR